MNFRVNLTEINRGLLGVLTGKWEDIPRYYDSIVPPEPEKELTEETVVENIRNKINQLGEG